LIYTISDAKVSQDPRKTSQLANQKIIMKAQTAGDLPQLMFSGLLSLTGGCN